MVAKTNFFSCLKMKKKYVQICCKKKSKQIDNPDNTVITVNGGFEGNLFSNTLMVERGKHISLLVCWDLKFVLKYFNNIILKGFYASRKFFL